MRTKLLILSIMALAGNVQAYTLEGAKWLPGNVPFYVDLGQYDSVATRELADWNQYTGRTHLIITTNSTTNGDPIYWRDGRSSIVWSTAADVIMPSNILAWCSIYNLPDHSIITESDVVVNDHFLWASFDGLFGPPNHYDIGRVLLHELGHAIGLGHSLEDAIMSPYYSGYRWELKADDIAGAQFLYGRQQNVPDTGSTIALTSLALLGLFAMRKMR